MLTHFFYARYAEDPRQRSFVPVIFSFALGLMAKPMLVSFPLLLLLLDLWPLDRPRDVRLLREKGWLFALALFSCVITFFAQHYGGAVMNFEDVGLATRVKVALTAYVGYLSHFFYPVDLVAFYPIQEISWLAAGGAAILLAAISFAVWRFRRRFPYLAVGWIYFLFSLVPVIGLVQVGDQAMADRYTYLPYLGLFLIVAWGAEEIVQRLPRARSPLIASLSLTLAVLAFMARAQTRHWRAPEALWEHTLEVYPDCLYALVNLGACYFEAQRVDDAQRVWEHAIEVTNPCLDRPRCRFTRGAVEQNLGSIYAAQRLWRPAAEHLAKAVAIFPDKAMLREMLALSLLWLDDPGAAAPHLGYLLQNGFRIPNQEPWTRLSRLPAFTGSFSAPDPQALEKRTQSP
jgi:tetratricopeptide (TPR) repeat protein